MKKIFAVLALLLVLAGCGADINTTVDYNSDKDTYKMTIDVYVDAEDIQDVTGGIASIDDMINNTFEDADSIDSEAGATDKTYTIVYTFDSTEDYNDFISENADYDAGLMSSANFRSYDYAVDVTVRSSGMSQYYVDGFASDAFDYGVEKAYISDGEVSPSGLTNENKFEFKYDGETLDSTGFEDSIELEAKSVEFTNIVDEEGDLTHTSVEVVIDSSNFSHSEEATNAIIDSYENRGYTVEEKEDTIVVSDKFKKNSVSEKLEFDFGMTNFERVKCEDNDNFLYTSTKCKVPEYKKELEVFGAEYDNDVKVNLKAFGETKNITKETEVTEIQFKTAGIIILVVSILGVIGIAILVFILLKKRGNSIKETSKNLASKVKDVSVKAGNASVAAAGNIKEKSSELNEKAKEASAADTENIELKLPNIGSLLFMLFLMLSSALNFNDSEVAFKFVNKFGGVEYTFPTITEVIRIVLVVVIVLLAITIYITKKHFVKIPTKIIKIITICVYGSVLLFWLLSLIAVFADGDELNVVMAMSAVVLLPVAILGLLSTIMNESKLNNFISKISLFDFYLLSLVLIMISTLLTFKEATGFASAFDSKVTYGQTILTLFYHESTVAGVLLILFYLIAFGGVVLYMIRKFVFKDENFMIGFIISVYNALFFIIAIITVIIGIGEDLREYIKVRPTLNFYLMITLSIVFAVCNIRAFLANKKDKVNEEPASTHVVTAAPVVEEVKTEEVKVETKIEDTITEEEVKAEEVKTESKDEMVF